MPLKYCKLRLDPNTQQIDTHWKTTDDNQVSDKLAIVNAARISIGGIDARATAVSSGDGGDSIVIGSESERAENIRVAHLWAQGMGRYSSGHMSGGNVYVYGSGDVIGYSRVDRSDSYGTDLIIENNIKGEITISGQIDLEQRAMSGQNGRLRLASNGKITLAGLDLSKIDFDTLVSGDIVAITGEIAYFNTTPGAENRLRVPQGQTVFYDYEPDVLNDHLQGQTWQLKALDGTSDGGLLVPLSEKPAAGTVIRFR